MRRYNELQLSRRKEAPRESKGVIKKAIIPTFCFAVLSTLAFEEVVFAESNAASASIGSEVSTSIKYVNISGGTLNLRKTAATSSPILVSLKNGTALTVYSEVNGWAHVQVNGFDGYVSAAFIAASSNSKTTAPVSTVKYVNTDSGTLNLRQNPQASGTILAKLVKGTAVTVYSESNGWAKVQVNGKDGYVSTEFLSAKNSSSTPAPPQPPTVVKDMYVNVSSGSLNMRNGSSTGASVIVKLAKGTPVKVYSEVNGWAKVEAYGKTGYVSAEFLSNASPSSSSAPAAPAPSPQLITKYVNINSGSSLNVRAAASTSSAIIGKLGFQSEVQVIAETNGWAKIQLNGKEGFVSSSFLTAVKPGSAVQQPEVPAAITKYVNVNIGSSLNMRKSPAANASILVKLARGLEVKVLSETNGWAKIEAYGQTGYVSSDFLSADKNLGDPAANTKEPSTETGANPPAGTEPNQEPTTGGSPASEPNTVPEQSTEDQAPAAVTKYVNVIYGSSLNMRSNPSTSAAIMTKLARGTIVTVELEENNWVKVTANGKTGYVSALYLSDTAPFNPNTTGGSVEKVVENYNIGLEDMVKLQMAVNPQTDKSYNAFIRSDALTLLNPTTGMVNGSGWNLRGGAGTEYWTVGQVKNQDTLQILAVVADANGVKWYQVAYNKTWVNASPDDVTYYVNPNNFTNSAVDSLQFLKLSVTANLNADEVNERVLAGKGILQGTAATFITAGMTYGVNEMYLIAHALLETSNGSSQLANGVLYNGKQVYNMYGIGAYDNTAVSSGAQFAYNAGWFTPEAAIIGGAQFIANGYINAGQDTLYKMRWNPASAVQKGYASHQYASDIGWAAKQVSQIYNLYSLIDSYKLVLEIPEFK